MSIDPDPEGEPGTWEFVDGNPISPEHYQFPGGAEAIDIAKHLSFPAGNVVKYVARAGRKDPSTHLEDLLKAQRYLEIEIERIRNDQR